MAVKFTLFRPRRAGTPSSLACHTSAARSRGARPSLPAWRKARRCLHEVGARRFRQPTPSSLFVVSQIRVLQDHLDQTAATGKLDDLGHLLLNPFVLTGASDVDQHVEFDRALVQRLDGLGHLD
jgi:hypothetical protein